MQVTIHVVLSLLAAVICLAVAGYIWPRRDVAGARGLLAFTLAGALWTAGNAFQAASTTLGWKLLGIHVQYVAIAAVPVSWFAFAAGYTGQQRWLNRWVLAAVAFPLVLLVLLDWTNALHGFVRTSVRLVVDGGVVRIQREFGLGFWLGVVYSNLVLGAGTLILLRALVRTRRIYRLQVLAIVGASLVPWVANLAYVTGGTSIEPEVFVSVTVLAFAFAMTRYQLFDLTPVARSTVLDELPDPVFVVDHTGRLVDVNAAAATVTGRDEHAMLGDRLADVLPETADIPTVADRPEDPPSEIELEVDGETRYYAPRVSAVAEDVDTGQIVVLRDVTNLARSRRDIERRNAQLEHVADVMSHDLRNPLNVAEGRLALARERATPDVESDLERVADAHDRMGSIIDSTLRAARASLGQADPEPVDLDTLCTRAWHSVETGDAAAQFDCEDATVRADPELAGSLLENLFRNAIEHGDAGTVRVTVTDDGFVVGDDGTGIADAELDRLFERGYTTTDDGTGLGLAIVSDVADAHGWTVDVSESDGGGARFAFGNVEVTRPPSG